MNGKVSNHKPFFVLLIGPLPPPIGGGQTVFKYLVDDLEKHNRCNVVVINTSRSIHSIAFIGNITAGVRVILKLLTKICTVDVVTFHASRRGSLLFGPLVYVVSHFFKKPCIFRFFGGGFDSFLESRGKILRWLFKKTVFSADACLFQTKKLVNYFNDIGLKNVIWFSNYTRNIPSVPIQLSRKTCNRYVFIGRIEREKGIDVILGSAPFLDDEVTIDIYGPLSGTYSTEEIKTRGGGRIHYCGVLSKEEVFKTLWEYDALVYPTCYLNEGYPGAILDGFSHGLPIIATDWMAIPEILDDTCSLLIEPGDTHGFARAVNLLHKDVYLFSRLRYGSFERAQNFSGVQWTEFFVELLQKTVEKNR